MLATHGVMRCSGPSVSFLQVSSNLFLLLRFTPPLTLGTSCIALIQFGRVSVLGWRCERGRDIGPERSHKGRRQEKRSRNREGMNERNSVETSLLHRLMLHTAHTSKATHVAHTQ